MANFSFNFFDNNATPPLSRRHGGLWRLSEGWECWAFQRKKRPFGLFYFFMSVLFS
jgi:hypothetical protein